MPKYLTLSAWTKLKAKLVKADAVWGRARKNTGIKGKLTTVERQLRGSNDRQKLNALKQLRTTVIKAEREVSKQMREADNGDAGTWAQYIEHMSCILKATDEKGTTLEKKLKTEGPAAIRKIKDLKIDMIFRSKNLRKIFRGFCVFQRSEENFEFYKEIKVGGRNQASQRHYDRYVKKGVKLEVNIQNAYRASWDEAAKARDWSKADMKSTIKDIESNLNDTLHKLKFNRDATSKKFRQAMLSTAA